MERISDMNAPPVRRRPRFFHGPGPSSAAITLSASAILAAVCVLSGGVGGTVLCGRLVAQESAPAKATRTFSDADLARLAESGEDFGRRVTPSPDPARFRDMARATPALMTALGRLARVGDADDRAFAAELYGYLESHLLRGDAETLGTLRRWCEGPSPPMAPVPPVPPSAANGGAVEASPLRAELTDAVRRRLPIWEGALAGSTGCARLATLVERIEWDLSEPAEQEFIRTVAAMERSEYPEERHRGSQLARMWRAPNFHATISLELLRMLLASPDSTSTSAASSAASPEDAASDVRVRLLPDAHRAHIRIETTGNLLLLTDASPEAASGTPLVAGHTEFVAWKDILVTESGVETLPTCAAIPVETPAPANREDSAMGNDPAAGSDPVSIPVVTSVVDGIRILLPGLPPFPPPGSPASPFPGPAISVPGERLMRELLGPPPMILSSPIPSSPEAGAARPVAGDLQRAVRRDQEETLTRASDYLDAEGERRIGAVRRRVKDRLLDPLADMGLGPTVRQASSTDSEIRFSLGIRTDLQRGGSSTPMFDPDSDSLLTLMVHESALNNLVHELGLDGASLSMLELQNRIAVQFNSPELLIADPEDGRFIVTFPESNSLRLQCRDDGTFVVTLRVAEFRDRYDGTGWNDLEVRAVYRLEMTASELRIVRAEPIRLLGPGVGGESQFRLRAIFGRIFGREGYSGIMPGDLFSLESLRNLRFLSVQIRNDWLRIELGEMEKRDETDPK